MTPHYQLGFVKHKGYVDYSPEQLRAVWEGIMAGKKSEREVADSQFLDPEQINFLMLMCVKEKKHMTDLAIAWGWDVPS